MTNEIPLFLFIFLIIVMFYFILQALNDTRIWSIFSALIATVLAFVLSKISINSQLVQNFGDISSTDTIIFGTYTVQNSAQSWLLLMVAIFMTIRLFIILIENYKEVYGEVIE